MREKCGVYGGIFPDVALELKRGLFSLQHRGQESCGISVVEDGMLKTIKGMGLVRDVLKGERISSIQSNMGIGHVRYSTAGSSEVINAQPLELTYKGSKLAVAHNGNLENQDEILKSIESHGQIFITDTDTEIFLHKLVRYFRSAPREWDPIQMAKVLFELKGAFSLLFLFENKIVAIRDPSGYRPLWIRRDENSILFSSEDSAFPRGGDVMEMEPGSVAVAKEDDFFYKRLVNKKSRQCVFEYIYFSRPDSNTFGKSVYEVRKKFGEKCAEENPVDADVVIPVMDSGLLAAIGFSKASGIPLEPALVRNPWVGRTFIEPVARSSAVKMKLSVVSKALKGKKVVLVDDSIVRGTTAKRIVELVRSANPSEVHFRVASPPVLSECFWGIDIPDKSSLIARHGIEKVREHLNVDSLKYLSLKSMCEVLGGCDNFCFRCFERDV
jgi:amidophosphoribosyltransferase